MNRCVVCRHRYYRRNQSITWKLVNDRWKKTVLRGHPECMKLYAKMVGLFRKAA